MAILKAHSGTYTEGVYTMMITPIYDGVSAGTGGDGESSRELSVNDV